MSKTIKNKTNIKLELHENSKDNVEQVHLGKIVEKNQLTYSDLVIEHRAIPSVFDGLKRVNRRLLFAFKESGNINKNIKSARVVGDTIGKFHPHGDISVYGSLVNMTQVFKNKYPLFNGQGNWGNIEGDSHAAMRYTECKLTQDNANLVFENFEKDGVVTWEPNYDDTLLEPRLLPVKYPVALLNGTTGIAYGSVTAKIPSYNILELTKLYIYLIENCFWKPEFKLDEHKENILSIIPSVDLPTGCNIYFEKDDQENSIFGSQFSFNMRANYEIDEKFNTITFKNIPDGVSADIIKKQAMLAGLSYTEDKNKKRTPKASDTDILNISENVDILSVSSFDDDEYKNDAEITFTFKKGVNLNVELMKVLKMTYLDSSFSAKMRFIDENSCPKYYSVYEQSLKFLEFKLHNFYKSFQYDIKKLEDNLHLLSGLKKIQSELEKFVHIVQSNEDDTMFDSIKAEFELDDLQIEYLLSISLRRLSKTNIDKMLLEIDEKIAKRDNLVDIISNKTKLYGEIKKDYENIYDKLVKNKKNHRLSQIIVASKKFSREDFIQDKEVIIMYMEDDTIAFVDKSKFRLKNKGTRTTNNKINNDFELSLKLSESCKLKDDLLLMTNIGRVFKLKAYMLSDEFRFIGNIINIDKNEHIVSILKYTADVEDKFYLIATENGKIKTIEGNVFKNITSNTAKRAITILDKDSVSSFLLCNRTENEKVILLTNTGKIIKYPTSEIAVIGNQGQGSRAAKLLKDEIILNSFVYEETEKTVLIGVSNTGKAKKTLTNKILEKKKTQTPNLWFNNDESNGTLVSAELIVDEEEEVLMVLTEKADVSFIKIKNFNPVSRTAKGAINLLKLEKNEKISSVKKVHIDELTPVQNEVVFEAKSEENEE